MATPTRIYHVNVEGIAYLVRAAHPSAALMHVARNIANVRVASQDDLVNCLADGIKVESAKEEAAAPEPEPAPDDKTLPLWPMPTPASGGFRDPQKAPLPEADSEDDDEEEDSRPAQDGQASGGVPQRQRIAARYRCPMTGSAWSGRGLQPTWLKVALASGKTLTDFAVTTEPA